jgi:hypothetical protein
MESIIIKSTSKSSATTDDLELRVSNTTRLIFRPLIIDNWKEHEASVKGTFIFQRKCPKGEWEDYKDLPLSSLRASEWIKLELKGVEVLELYKRLSTLYDVYKQDGIPSGEAQYIRMDQGLGALLTANEDDLHQLFDNETEGVATLISRLLKWLSSSNTPDQVLGELEKLNITNLQQIRSIVGLSALKASLEIWNENKDNSSEEFWQNTLEKYSFVLSQVFAYPIIVVKEKAYVGGKSISNSGGNLVDFLAKNEISNNAVLIEIKTPTTELLGRQYRGNAFSISPELSGAVVQAANYKSSLQNQYQSLFHENEMGLEEAFEPACVVIIGNYSKEINQSVIKKKSLGLFRSHLKDIMIITYDELFGKVQLLVNLLEGSFENSDSKIEEDDDMPF